LKKIKKIVSVLMSLVVEKESAANVLAITGGWVNFLEAYSLRR
jgi:hypothetical protein